VGVLIRNSDIFKAEASSMVMSKHCWVTVDMTCRHSTEGRSQHEQHGDAGEIVQQTR
jgi:hypothetical protein